MRVPLNVFTNTMFTFLLYRLAFTQKHVNPSFYAVIDKCSPFPFIVYVILMICANGLMINYRAKYRYNPETKTAKLR